MSKRAPRVHRLRDLVSTCSTSAPEPDYCESTRKTQAKRPLDVVVGVDLARMVKDLPGELREDSAYSRALLGYLSTLGDASKAASLSNVPAEQIRSWAAADHWDKKVKELMTLREDRGQAAFAKELNRLLNLTQAVRLRGLVDAVIRRVSDSESSLADFLSTPIKGGGKAFSARGLADVAKAALAIHQLTYAALADQTSERIQAAKDAKKAEEPDLLEAPSLAVFRTLAQYAQSPHPLPLAIAPISASPTARDG